MVAKGFQGPRGTQGMGEMSYNQIDHIQVIFLHDIQNRAISPLKSPEIPIKNENGLQFVISWSITLKIELWAPYTIWQAVLKGQVILRQKAYFGPDYCP